MTYIDTTDVNSLIGKMEEITKMKKLYDEGISIKVSNKEYASRTKVFTKGVNDFEIDFENDYEVWDGLPYLNPNYVIGTNSLRYKLNEYLKAVKEKDSSINEKANDALCEFITLTFHGGKEFIEKYFNK